MNDLPEDHWKNMFPEFEFKLQDDYYKFRGWNKEGIPRAETLHKLGRDYVRDRL